MCISSCDQLESVGHLFLDIPLFGSLWYDIYRWLDIVIVCPINMLDHLNQFGYFVGISKSHRIWMFMIWCACIWIIWKGRNNKKISDKPASTLQLIDIVKLISFWWLKAKILKIVFDYHRWGINPLIWA